MVHRQDAFRALQKLSRGSFKVNQKAIKVGGTSVSLRQCRDAISQQVVTVDCTFNSSPSTLRGGASLSMVLQDAMLKSARVCLL